MNESKKVSELTGSDLDYWALVARNISSGLSKEDAEKGAKLALTFLGASPSRNWAEGGAIIEREKIQLWTIGDEWIAKVNCMAGNSGIAPTPLIAAMRAYVASVYGDEVSDGPA